jgi:hypothetical protein
MAMSSLTYSLDFIPKQNKLAEKISQKNPEYMLTTHCHVDAVKI